MAQDARLSRVFERYEGTLVVRVMRRMIAINGYDRALALSAQAFVGLIPALAIVAAVLPEGLRQPGLAALVEGLGLSGEAASATTALVHRPPGVETLTVLGSVLLVVSVLGFTRALQRTYLSAWGLPSTGLRGLGGGLLAATALVGGLGGLALLVLVLALVKGYVLVKLVVHAVAATLLWWPVQRLLLGGRVGWRPLLPGAALTGAGQAVVLVLSGIYLPAAVSREATRYGLIGVAVALVSWLVVLGLLLVLSAVLGAELARVDGSPEDP